MKIEYTGRQVEVPRALMAVAERKLRKLERALGSITHTHVVLAADGHRQRAEVTVNSPRVQLSATTESGDLGISLTRVLDKLARQAERHAGRWQGQKRRGPSLAGPASRDTRSPRTTAAPRLIRSRLSLAKPMTVDEAALEVDDQKDGLILFRDAATGRVNVLYRRKDGNLGLIEPEG